MGFWRTNDNRYMLLDESGNYYVGQDNVGTTVAVRAETSRRSGTTILLLGTWRGGRRFTWS